MGGKYINYGVDKDDITQYQDLAEPCIWVSAVLLSDTNTNGLRVLSLFSLQNEEGHLAALPIMPEYHRDKSVQYFSLQEIRKKEIRRRLGEAMVSEGVQKILCGDEKSNAIGNRTLRENIISKEQETRLIFIVTLEKILKDKEKDKRKKQAERRRAATINRRKTGETQKWLIASWHGRMNYEVEGNHDGKTGTLVRAVGAQAIKMSHNQSKNEQMMQPKDSHTKKDKWQAHSFVIRRSDFGLWPL